MQTMPVCRGMNLNGPFVPHHTTPEGRVMAEMKNADLARLAWRSTER
jgi:hypothetical protein